MSFTESPSPDLQVTARQGHPASPYLAECQHLHHIGHVPFGLHPTGFPGRGMKEQMSLGASDSGHTHPTAGRSHWLPMPCRTEILPGKGQHGAGPCAVCKHLAAVTLWTLCCAGRGCLWSRAMGTRNIQPRASTAPHQHPPRFCGPAPAPRQWRPRPQPRLLKPPPCPACPWAPLSSPLANGQSPGLRRAGRIQQGRDPTCRGWHRTSTLQWADVGMDPGWQLQKAPVCSLLLLCTPSPFQGVWL